MQKVERSFIGAGQIYIQPYDKSAPLLPIGNVSEFTFSFEEDRKELKNYLGGGGNRNVVTRVSNITASLAAHDFTAENIALALRGSVAVTESLTISDEQHPSFGIAGELIPFNKLPDLKKTITVKDASDSALVVGDDYEVTSAGIRVLQGGLIDDTGVSVSYSPLKADMVQALVASGSEFTLFMEGLNDAQEGSPFNIRVHRIKFSPVQNLGFISDDFAAIALQLDVLSDTNITDAGLSPFMQIDLAK